MFFFNSYSNLNNIKKCFVLCFLKSYLHFITPFMQYPVLAYLLCHNRQALKLLSDAAI